VRAVLLLIALLCSTLAHAEKEKSAMIELPGTCEHADRFAFQLTRLMDFSSSSSINCAGAKTDWKTSIEFFKQSSFEDSLIKFTGKPGKDGLSLEVTGVIDFGLDRTPATGRCQMFRADNSAGKREIACFVKLKDGSGGRSASFVRFTVDDEVLAAGETKQYPGNCSSSPIGKAVMKEEVARVYQGYRPIEHLPTASCDSATITGGKSVTFENANNPESKVVFSGSADQDDVSRILVTSLAFGNESPKPAITGTCVGIRRMDGFLHTLCQAAFEDGGKIKAVSVEFPEPLPDKY
jgi:hypothetical protein